MAWATRIKAICKRDRARALAGYRIGRLLGSGRSTRVFVGRKGGPGRFAKMAAIKLLERASAADPDRAAAFLEQARLTARINHPNVCRALDFGAADGTYYLVLDYVPGRRWGEVLAALARDQALRARVPALAAYVFTQACEGVHALHQVQVGERAGSGLVHGELAPQDLMIGYDGSVYVLDLGAARREGDSSPRASEISAERRAYRAPEQIAGDVLDRRADVWSLGVMLREAVRRASLHEGEPERSVWPLEIAPAWPDDLPRELCEIIDRALVCEVATRVPSARQLGSALSSYLTRTGECALNDELARAMDKLFAWEIEREQASVRELADAPSACARPTLRARLFAGAQLRRAALTFGALVALGAGVVLGRGAQAKPWSYGALQARATELPSVNAQRVEPSPTEPIESGAKPSPSPALAEAPAPSAALQPPAPSAALQPPAPSAALQPPAPSAALQPPAPEDALRDRTTSVPPPAPALLRAAAPAGAPRDGGASAPSHPPALPLSAAGSRRQDDRASSTPTATRLAERVANLPTRPGLTRSAPDPSATGTAPPVRTQFGTVVVGATSGWAELSAGGRSLGTTPLQTELPSGRQILEVRPYGTGAVQRIPITIQAARVTKLQLTL